MISGPTELTVMAQHDCFGKAISVFDGSGRPPALKSPLPIPECLTHRGNAEYIRS